MAMSNGKLIVIAIFGIVGVWIAAGLLWTDAPGWPEERDAAPLPPLPESLQDHGDKPLRITDRKQDGTVVVTNVPDGQESRVDQSRARRAAEAEARVESEEEVANPFAGFVDDGSPLTESAMTQRVMSELTGGEQDYDPVTEARQRFHEFEIDLLAAAPLSPESWRQVTAEHRDELKDVFKRSMALTSDGHPDEARALIEEWNELQGKYQAQAYGRAPQPVEPQ